MGEPKDEERDEEWFKEVYGKEYTGPVRPTNENTWDNLSSKKRSVSEENDGEPDEDDALPDPNAVPTDFTSREAKVWEAKAKAIERNWKKKKEDELICRICGEYGHFSQGCPTTLGANRKHSDIVEKVPVKDKRLKPRIIGTGGATIRGIEKDTGCKLKLEDNLVAGNGSFFVRISGSSRAMVGKAVNAVKKLLDHVQHDWKPQGSYRSHGSHNHARQVPYVPNQPPHHDLSMQSYPGQDVPYYGDDHNGSLEQVNNIDGRRQWDNQNGSFPIRPYGGEDPVLEIDAGYDWQSVKSLESLEQKFVQETMRLTKELNDAEDKENTRHREAIREIQELYQQKMASLRTQQTKQREDFLRQESQFRQRQYQQYQQAPVQSGFKYYDYEMGLSSSGGNDNRDIGYNNLVDRNDELAAGYRSFRSDGGYHNASHSFRSSGYDGAMHHLRNQEYDGGHYRY